MASPYRIDITVVRIEPGFCVKSRPITVVTRGKNERKSRWIASDITFGSPWSPFFRGVAREYYGRPLHNVGNSLNKT